MREQIQLELAKLQTELSTLGTAVSQINKAEKLSTELVESIQAVKDNFDTKITELLTKVEEQISEHSKISTDKVTAAMAAHKQQAGENTSSLNSFKVETEKYISFSEEKLSEIRKQVTDQIATTDKLLANYLELAKSTTNLSKSIDNVNFPERLDQITVNIGILNDHIRNIETDLSKVSRQEQSLILEKKLNKSNRRAVLTIVLLVIAILILTGIGFETILLKYFPELLEKIKQ